MSIPRPTNAAGMPVEGSQITQEQFYAFLEQEMRKIEMFTKKQVKEIRKILSEVESQTGTIARTDTEAYADMLLRVQGCAEDFLK